MGTTGTTQAEDPAFQTFDWYDAQVLGEDDGPQLSLGRPGFLLFLGMLVAALRRDSGQVAGMLHPGYGFSLP